MKNQTIQFKRTTPPLACQLFGRLVGLAAVILICSSAAAQNLFMSDGYSGISEDLGHIYKFTPTGASSAFASGLDGPEGVAFDSAGNLFMAAEGNIYKFTPGGARTTFASGVSLSYLYGLAFDSAGNLFVADPGAGNAGSGICL
jgi:DNA-binding beta-propeller fold protein YncE